MNPRDLTSKLAETATTNRLNTVEAALAGEAGSQQNFQGEWMGYDEQGRGLVKVNGTVYTGSAIAPSSITKNSSVMLRAGRGLKTINW